jgi:hypothetical protein
MVEHELSVLKRRGMLSFVERRPGLGVYAASFPEVTMNLAITLGEGNVKHSRLVHHVWSMCAQAAPLDGRASGRQLVRTSVLPSFAVIGANWVLRVRRNPVG